MQLEILTEADLQKFKTELFDELKKMNVGGSAIFDQRKWGAPEDIMQHLQEVFRIIGEIYKNKKRTEESE